MIGLELQGIGQAGLSQIRLALCQPGARQQGLQLGLCGRICQTCLRMGVGELLVLALAEHHTCHHRHKLLWCVASVLRLLQLGLGP